MTKNVTKAIFSLLSCGICSSVITLLDGIIRRSRASLLWIPDQVRRDLKGFEWRLSWGKIVCALILGIFTVTNADNAWAVAQNKFKEKNVETFMHEYGIKAENQGRQKSLNAELDKNKKAVGEKLEPFKNLRDTLLEKCVKTSEEAAKERWEKAKDQYKKMAEAAGEAFNESESLLDFLGSSAAAAGHSLGVIYQGTRALWDEVGGGTTVDGIWAKLKTSASEWLATKLAGREYVSYNAQAAFVEETCSAFYDRDSSLEGQVKKLKDQANELEDLNYSVRQMSTAGYGDEIYVHKQCTKRRDGTEVCSEIQFVVNVEENKIMSVAGATIGCMPLPFKLYEARSCLFCPMFEVIYNALQKAATKAYSTLSKPLSTLLLIGLAIWIALMVLGNVSAMTKQDAPKFLTDLFKNSFKVVIIFILLRYSSIVYDVIIGPLLKAGFEFGNSFLERSGDLMKTCEAKNYTSAVLGVIPSYVYTHLVCFIEAVQYELAATQAIGSSLMCIARHAGSDSLAVFAKVLPDFSMLFQGALIWLISFILSIAFAFYLIDAVIQLGIFGILLPFLLMCYPFKITHGYFNTGVGVFMNSWFIFVFMGLITNMTISLIAQGATGGKGDMTEIEIAINGNDISTLKNLLDIGYAGFIVLVACCVIGIKLMSKVQDLAGQFGHGGLKLGIGNKIGGLAASGATNFAKFGASKAGGMVKGAANARVFGSDGNEKSIMDYARGTKNKAARLVGKGIQYVPKKIGKFAGKLAGLGGKRRS